MKFKHLAQMFLSLCLVAQLNFAEANKNYDEEITLPVGTNFDLEMEEITRYEYDGNYVKAQTVNGKEQFILQKTGNTIINVIMEENGQKTEMRVLVHIVTEQQFNGTEPAKEAPKATTKNKPAANTPAKSTTPAAANQTKPAATAPTANSQTKPATTAPAANSQTKPAATAPAVNSQTKPAATTPATTTQSKPAANAPAKATTPATTPQTKPAATAPATAVTQPSKITAPAQTAPTTSATAPVATTSKVYGTAVSRPANITPANTIEAAKLKAQQLSFDVLDLVNAERAKAGLTPLTMTKDLMDTALVRAKEIPKRFSHTRPDNTRYFTAMTMQGSVREENIAAGQTTATAVVKAWMAAPNSKEIILNPAFRELGVGYFETIGANYACYWVQIFRG